MQTISNVLIMNKKTTWCFIMLFKGFEKKCNIDLAFKEGNVIQALALTSVFHINDKDGPH